MDKANEYTIEDIAFGLSNVFLNEEDEECEFGLQDIDDLNNVCLKIVKALDSEDVALLAHLRPNTFINSIESKHKLDEIMQGVTNPQTDNKEDKK